MDLEKITIKDLKKAMENKCTECGMELILKPAGVARATGKPYEAFWACTSGLRHKQSKPQFNSTPQPQNVGKVNISAIDPILLLSDEVVGLRSQLKAFGDKFDLLDEFLRGRLK